MQDRTVLFAPPVKRAVADEKEKCANDDAGANLRQVG